MKPQYELFYKQLGLNIAFYRKLRGLTQLDLAEFTDLSRTHISNIEAPNVKTRISLDTLFSIAEVLQISQKTCWISACRKKDGADPWISTKPPSTLLPKGV